MMFDGSKFKESLQRVITETFIKGLSTRPHHPIGILGHGGEYGTYPIQVPVVKTTPGVIGRSILADAYVTIDEAERYWYTGDLTGGGGAGGSGGSSGGATGGHQRT